MAKVYNGYKEMYEDQFKIFAQEERKKKITIYSLLMLFLVSIGVCIKCFRFNH